MKPVFFKSRNDFREWLEKNHESETELVVGYYKVNSSRHNMTWSHSVDEALCYGWIDGIRRSIDEEKYCIRFTPRKPTSIWSKVNIDKVEELKKKGLMKEAGLKAYEKRKKSGIYSFENVPDDLSPEYEKQFRANKEAWDFFSNLAPSYRRTTIHWIMTAKQEQTRLSRLKKAIEVSEKHNRIY